MKASELKNVSWIAKLHDIIPSNFDEEEVKLLCWEVVDSKGNTIVEETDESTAKAIAALPDTLKRLEKLEGVFALSIEEIEKRKENIINKGEKMPQAMLEGGVMAFDASIDAIKETLKKALKPLEK